MRVGLSEGDGESSIATADVDDEAKPLEVVRLVNGVVSLRRRAEHGLAEDLGFVGVLIHVLPERRAVRELEPWPTALDRTRDLAPGAVLRLAVHERPLAHAPRRSRLQRFSH